MDEGPFPVQLHSQVGMDDTYILHSFSGHISIPTRSFIRKAPHGDKIGRSIMYEQHRPR